MIQKSKSAAQANNSFSMKESNAFVIATKIKDTFEIGQIVGSFEGKFKMMPESWFLEKNADGINIYTDKKDTY
jgi:hypothetical protein